MVFGCLKAPFPPAVCWQAARKVLVPQRSRNVTRARQQALACLRARGGEHGADFWGRGKGLASTGLYGLPRGLALHLLSEGHSEALDALGAANHGASVAHAVLQPKKEHTPRPGKSTRHARQGL